MKRFFTLVFVIFILCLLGIFGYILMKKNTEDPEIRLPSESETSTLEEKNISESENINNDSQNYKIVWITVNDNKKLFLYSNLDSKLSSKELSTKNTCEYLSSGGFFDTNNNHIGLFITEGETISEIKDNQTFNGFINVSKDGISSITRYPVFSPRISLQTGPILFENGEKLDLKLENDENARRIVAAIDKSGNIYFFAFYVENNKFNGPTLSELPGMIEQLDKNKNLQLTSAINLDGGAHSAFISNLDTLSEASPIGSFFCIKP